MGKRKNKSPTRPKNKLENGNVKTTEVVNYANFGASKTKNAFRGIPDVIQNSKVDIGYNKDTMIARSRNAYMGMMLGSGAIKKIRTNVVGKGLQLKSNINNVFLNLPEDQIKLYETQIEELWRLWANSTTCDIRDFSNFNQLQSLAIITMLMDGDCIVLLPFEKNTNQLFDLKIQIIDSARVKNPPNIPIYNASNIQNGVELNENGKAIAYYIKADETGTKYKRVEVTGKNSGRKNILVLMEKERSDQVRGVPLLMNAMEGVLQINKFTELEVMNAAISALFTVFFETDSDVVDETDENPLENVEKIEDLDGDINYKMGSATMLELPPGKKVKFADPQRPNSKFDGFVTAVAKQIGAALEIPYEVLLNAFNSSYSASRAALMEVWKMYMMRREWFITDFCQPIFEEWLDEAVAKGYIDLPGYKTNILLRKAYQRAEWYGPAQGQLDPLKEVNASIKKIEAGLSTIEQETAILNGGNSDKNFEIRKQEAAKNMEIEKIKRDGRKGGEKNVVV